MLGIFLDTETNGLDFYKHRVLEIAFRLIDLTNFSSVDSYQSIVKQSNEVWEQSNPESLNINGFTREKMDQGKSEEKVASEITNIFQKHKIHRDSAVFICQNPSFDRAFFAQLINSDTQEGMKWPYHWLDLASMYWSYLLTSGSAPWHSGISKNEIAKHFHIPNEQLPHEAMSGVEHLVHCYRALFKQVSIS